MSSNGDSALAHMAAGELAQAERLLRESVRREPEAVDARANLGAVLQQRGHVREAIEHYRAALQVDPDDAGLRCNLAKALSDAGEFDAAAAEAQTAVDNSGGHPFAVGTLGAVYIDRGDYPKALQILGDATVLPHLDDMALVNLALAQAAVDDCTNAVNILEQALDQNPHNARALADYAHVLTRTGDVAGAVQACENFLSVYPAERLVLGAYALALSYAGRDTEAQNLTDCDRLLQVFDVDAVDGFDSVTAFNTALVDCLRADASRLTNPVSKSTEGGDQTGELDLEANGPTRALRALIEAHISAAANRYLDAGLARHALMLPAQEPQSLRVWGTLLRSGGRQTPHMHPLGWLSGVYYAQVPKGMEDKGDKAGWIEFNRPPARFNADDRLNARTFEPFEGRLMIFPSWFWHQTLPFAANGERISVAFDAVPTSALRML